MGGLLASYNTYNQSQTIRQAALAVKAQVRLAQSKALSSLKPSSGCTVLDGYEVRFTATAIASQALCDESILAGGTTEFTLSSGVTFSPLPASFTFGILSRGLLEEENPIDVVLTGFGKTYRMSISPNGDIEDSGFE